MWEERLWWWVRRLWWWVFVEVESPLYHWCLWCTLVHPAHSTRWQSSHQQLRQNRRLHRMFAKLLTVSKVIQFVAEQQCVHAFSSNLGWASMVQCVLYGRVMCSSCALWPCTFCLWSIGWNFKFVWCSARMNPLMPHTHEHKVINKWKRCPPWHWLPLTSTSCVDVSSHSEDCSTSTTSSDTQQAICQSCSSSFSCLVFSLAANSKLQITAFPPPLLKFSFEAVLRWLQVRKNWMLWLLRRPSLPMLIATDC